MAAILDPKEPVTIEMDDRGRSIGFLRHQALEAATAGELGRLMAKVWVVAMSGKHPKRQERPGVDRAGRAALHYAAADGDVARVRDLLASGIDPRAADDDGWTPLHFAAQKSAVDVVQLLLKAGATVDPRDANGNTPLANAVFNSRGNGEIIKLLRASGADPFANNAHGVSPLNLARTIANFDVRQFFSDLPEDDEAEPVDVPDRGGR
jgi:uncharacterized protein